MRDKSKPATLNEMMGKGVQGHVSMENLHELLGDIMPEMPRNKVGKLRLIHSLQKRLGANFRQYPGVNDLLSEFDKDVEFEEIVSKNRENK